MNFIVMPMFFLSGAMYPVKQLPKLLKIFTMLNPFTYGIDALKHAMFRDSGVFDFPALLNFGVLAVSSIIFVITAGALFNRKK
jgi:ABC-2 type transport system permease protein